MATVPTVVFHVALITESVEDKENSILTFAEATFATRFDADRVARVYREILAAGFVKSGQTDKAFWTRVGVLEVPAPDPRIGHRRPLIPTAEIPAFITLVQKENQYAAPKL